MSSSALKEEQNLEEELQGQEDTVQIGETVGQILSKTRRSNRLSLEKAARVIRISETYLEALEQDNQDKLPEHVYTTGFIKSYASYLGLDPHEMSEIYKKQVSLSVEPKALDFPAPTPERHIPSKWLIFIATFLALTLFIAWSSLHPWKLSEPPADSVTPEIAYNQGMAKKTAPAILSQAPAEEKENADKKADHPSPSLISAAQEPTQQATEPSAVVLEGKNLYLGPGINLLITANHPSWIEIKTKEGRILVNKTLRAGESEEIKARDDLTFSTGNAGDLSFYIDGRTYSPLGKPGQIMSGLKLKFEYKS